MGFINGRWPGTATPWAAERPLRFLHEQLPAVPLEAQAHA